jgi:hypothetical protein
MGINLQAPTLDQFLVSISHLLLLVQHWLLTSFAGPSVLLVTLVLGTACATSTFGKAPSLAEEFAMHECPHCRFRFEDAESLRRHLEEGRGCPSLDDIRIGHQLHMMQF